jgi:hypothetical protein
MLDADALEEHLRTYGVDVQSLALERERERRGGDDAHGRSGDDDAGGGSDAATDDDPGEGSGATTDDDAATDDDGAGAGADRTLALAYMTAFPGDAVDHAEMGRALNALIDLAEDGEWEPCRLEATVERSPGDVLGTWYARRAWFEDYLAYRIDDETLSARVLDTLEE